MKKQSYAKILAAVLTVGGIFYSVPLAVQAETDDFEFLPRIYDEADVLTDDEESALLDRLDSISNEYDFDVAVVTVNSTDGEDITYFSDAFYDDNYYGMGDDYDGILFVVDMGDRKWHFTTHGYGMTVFNNAGLEYLENRILPDLKNDDFATAFNIYADQCELFLKQAATGTPYDSSNLPKEPFSIRFWIPVSLGIGLVLAFLCTMGMRAQLKSVRSQESAVDYVRKGSMNVTRSNDIFLYSTVTRTAKPKEDDSSTGGSDSDHGGRSGSF